MPHRKRIERRTHPQNHDGVIGGKTPEENTQFEQEIERLTGIKVTMNKPATDYDQKRCRSLPEKIRPVANQQEKMSTSLNKEFLRR